MVLMIKSANVILDHQKIIKKIKILRRCGVLMPKLSSAHVLQRTFSSFKQSSGMRKRQTFTTMGGDIEPAAYNLLDVRRCIDIAGACAPLTDPLIDPLTTPLQASSEEHGRNATKLPLKNPSLDKNHQVLRVIRRESNLYVSCCGNLSMTLSLIQWLPSGAPAINESGVGEGPEIVQIRITCFVTHPPVRGLYLGQNCCRCGHVEVTA